MADNLPKSGIELVVENAKQANRDLKSFQSALNANNKAITNAARSSSSVSKLFASVQNDLGGIAQQALAGIPAIGKFTGSMTAAGAAGGTMATGIGAALPVIGAFVVATGGAYVALKAFLSLGRRGADLQNTLQAFGNTVGDLADATEVLRGLRAATRGTVEDAELLRLSTASLAGQSNEFKSILLQNVDGVSQLGKVFDITARAARAQGQSVEVVREKFLTGLRLQSKLRLDDIGVQVQADVAQRRYAESIGKTAAALTEAERKQAFLNEALLQLDRIAAESPINRIQETFARLSALLTNIRDKMAMAIQPIFEPFAMGLDNITSAITNLASVGIPLFSALAKIVGTVFKEAMLTANTISKAFLGDMASGTGSTLTYVVAAFSLASDVITGVIRGIGQAVRGLIGGLKTIATAAVRTFGDLFGGVNKNAELNINQLAYNLGYGGAFVIGSFAGGILKGGTKVLEAVTSIAQIVADFLMGFSPPKRGVLKNIDKGGANVAIAWADGFLGGVKGTFGEVTQYVNDRLGGIARMSREQLEGALARLDLAIRPFKEQLQIVKADMEAIAGFTDPALRVIERQRTALLKAFGRGEIADIDALRTTDTQVQKLKELKDFAADQSDQAEVQLKLAEAQQIQQRTLLQIALARLGVAQDVAGTEEKAAKALKEAALKGGGGAASAEALANGAGAGFGGGLPDLLSNEAIDAAKARIIGAFTGIGSQALAGASAGLGDSGFGGALGGFQAQRAALQAQLARAAGANPAQGIVDKFAGLKEQLEGAINPAKEAVQDIFKSMFGEEGVITGYLNAFRDKLLGVFTGDESPVTLAKNALADALMTMGEDMFWLKDQIDEKLGLVGDFLTDTFSGDDSLMAKAAQAVSDQVTNMINGFLNLTNEGAGTLKDGLSTLGNVLYDAILMPVHNAMQSLVNSVVNTLTSLFSSIGGALGDLLGISIPSFPSVTLELPQRAKGTLGDSSPFIAGERGKELIMPAKNNPLSVFPAKATSALQRLASRPMMPTAPAAMPAYSRPQQTNQNTYNQQQYNQQRSIAINARYQMTEREMRLAAARMS